MADLEERMTIYYNKYIGHSEFTSDEANFIIESEQISGKYVFNVSSDFGHRKILKTWKSAKDYFFKIIGEFIAEHEIMKIERRGMAFKTDYGELYDKEFCG